MPVDDGLQHRATALAHDVGEHDSELEVGVLQHLVDAQDVRAALTHELLARARERAQLLYGWDPRLHEHTGPSPGARGPREHASRLR